MEDFTCYIRLHFHFESRNNVKERNFEIGKLKGIRKGEENLLIFS